MPADPKEGVHWSAISSTEEDSPRNLCWCSIQEMSWSSWKGGEEDPKKGFTSGNLKPFQRDMECILQVCEEEYGYPTHGFGNGHGVFGGFGFDGGLIGKRSDTEGVISRRSDAGEESEVVIKPNLVHHHPDAPDQWTMNIKWSVPVLNCRCRALII